MGAAAISTGGSGFFLTRFLGGGAFGSFGLVTRLALGLTSTEAPFSSGFALGFRFCFTTGASLGVAVCLGAWPFAALGACGFGAPPGR